VSGIFSNQREAKKTTKEKNRKSGAQHHLVVEATDRLEFLKNGGGRWISDGEGSKSREEAQLGTLGCKFQIFLQKIIIIILKIILFINTN
jgi:hypothetical protein